MLKKRCIICGKRINSGIMINGKVMCKDCEFRLINLEMDTDFYEYYKKKIKGCLNEEIEGKEEKSCQDYQ